MAVSPGSLVRYREREWIVLPSDDPGLTLLRPIGGSSREVCGVVKPMADLMAFSLPYERIEPASFPLPDPAQFQDHAAVRLLMESSRLLLRDGAAPFRSLGHLSVRPRPYQFVPLVMALRQDTVRLLIADDVGVGKTIEASLVARELLDRGEVRRVAVLSPPYLCEQWQRELAEKFHIDAVVIRAGTVARLERHKPPNQSIFEHYPHFVASIDTVKGERYRASFLQHCPELVLVDEVHGAAAPPGNRGSRAQQQRHELLVDLARNPQRHLVLLTATPHSGVEASFQSLLGLLRPAFRGYRLTQLSQDERRELAQHFVQRRRADVKLWMGEETPFPKRDTEGAEQPYQFSPAYREFYNTVYSFASDMVRSAETLTGWRRRMRFWSALALLRCVTSSPAAAEVALLKRVGGEDGAGQGIELLDSTTDDELDAEFSPLVGDPMEAESVVDTPPSAVFDTQERDAAWSQADRQGLRQFALTARKLRGKADAKLQKAVETTAALLAAGYHPIIWCRYIATADYVADELQRALAGAYPGLRVTSITGALAEDERRLKVDELTRAARRVLVATDCLSEGINLQEAFSAAVHYDLPWNPNRLEQREGRVDRYGQRSATVKAVMIFGQDNPVDGAVLDVLLRKAHDIYRELGVYVPVPMDSEGIMQAVLSSLFQRSREMPGVQLNLFEQGGSDEATALKQRVHDEWTRAAAREKESRTRFAQRAIKPEEVAQELEETDAVLGSPGDVQRFLAAASQRLGFGLRNAGHGRWELRVSELPAAVGLSLGVVPDLWPITFQSPTPEGLTYIGRNHPLIERLAEHLVDLAFHPLAPFEGEGRGEGEAPTARCGVIGTDQVQRRTALFLLRLRFLVHDGDTPTLAEETLTWGARGVLPDLAWLSLAEAQSLLDGARPAANVPAGEKRAVLAETLGWWPRFQSEAARLHAERASHLQESHRRVRRLIRDAAVRVEPQSPPDLLGVLVLLPPPK
jgi:superfamily II DNA or RNA helicase